MKTRYTQKQKNIINQYLMECLNELRNEGRIGRYWPRTDTQTGRRRRDEIPQILQCMRERLIDEA